MPAPRPLSWLALRQVWGDDLKGPLDLLAAKPGGGGGKEKPNAAKLEARINLI